MSELRVAAANTGGGVDAYRFVETVYFTSSGTFSKGDYPWLRAIRVKCVGAGGGGGGVATTGSSQVSGAPGGGGGGYAESFITDIAGLASSVTVTRGAGGAGGAAGANTGATGGTSSFGGLVVAEGGGGGPGDTAGAVPKIFGAVGAGGLGTAGDITVAGGNGQRVINVVTSFALSGAGGGTVFASVREPSATNTGANGGSGVGFGAGGSGALNAPSQGTARSGGAGADGILIVELYA